MTESSHGPRVGAPPSSARRAPTARLGVAVVQGLVESIVTGDIPPRGVLPPEDKLSERFAVSRTVIRESVKRVEEKGLISVVPGRGTIAEPKTKWNILDPVVLTSFLEHDSSLGVLDEIATIRGSLEGIMSAATARHRSAEQLARITAALDRMGDSLADPEAFQNADADFHFVVMELSGNELARGVTQILFSRARQSARFVGNQTVTEFRQTLQEHRRVYDAIAAGDAATAESAMRAHIADSWQRRRFPTTREL